MIIRALKTYLTSLSPYGKDVDLQATIATANRAPRVYKSATRTVATSSSSSSSSTNRKHSIPSFRFAGPTAAAFTCRLSYYAYCRLNRTFCRLRSTFCRLSSLKQIFYEDIVDNLYPELIRIEGRQCTNTVIAANVLAYVAQRLSGGKLLHLGAKTNDLIRNRQLWRLVTSSFLHANIGQLMASCYSLYTLGPGVEIIYGPRRYLAVYITSAIAGSGMSYWLCKSATAGASGAIFGLIGSYSYSYVMFLSRQPEIEESEDDEKDIDRYWIYVGERIIIDLVAGMLYKGADKWGNVGGLIGGAAASWLVGSREVSLYPTTGEK